MSNIYCIIIVTEITLFIRTTSRRGVGVQQKYMLGRIYTLLLIFVHVNYYYHHNSIIVPEFLPKNLDRCYIVYIYIHK